MEALIRSSCFLLCFILLGSGRPSPSESISTKTHTVEIIQMKFKPDKLTVHKGDTILFINKDLVKHDVTEEPGNSWRSPALATGESWRLVVTQNTGYFCSFHPIMKGKIVVK